MLNKINIRYCRPWWP